MSDNWNQNSDTNQPKPPPKTGGLLSNYKTQQPDQGIPDARSMPGANSASSPAGPQRNNSSLLRGGFQQQSPTSQQGQFSPSQANPGMQQRSQSPQPYNAGNQQWSPVAPQPGQQYPRQPQPQSMTPQQRHGLLSNTVDMMRRWSGKFASVAGHQVQPPAPYLDRYRPASMPGVEMSPSRPSRPWKRSRVLRINQHIRQRRLKSRQGGVGRVLAITLATLLVLVLLTSFGSSAYGYSYYVQQQPRMEEYANQHIDQNTRIYDRNGVLLYEAYDNTTSAYSGRRVTVRYEDIPLIMQNAMTSIEDKTFWTNAGIDPLAIVRAGSSGYGGASTLTQQVIKNLTRDTNPTYQRKLTEAAMAIGLTQQYSKSKIMEMYFNVAPFGAQTYGVEVAAEDYFGLKPTCKVNQPCTPGISNLDYNTRTRKHDPILGLARASFLAGQPNAPSATDPTMGAENKQRALDRQKLVLNAMITQGMTVNGQADGPPITEAIAKQAEDLMAKQTFHPYQRIMKAPHFVQYVIDQMVQALGGGNAGLHAFQTGGYNIRTTIDINLVNYTQNEITRHIYQPDIQKVTGYNLTLSTDNNVHNAAVVVMDSKTGEILGMNGSADFNSTDPTVNGQFNAAINARPPGSTFKPFDYATAFQMGWNPAIVLQDNETFFPTGSTAGVQIPTSQDQINAMSKAGLFYAPSDYGQTWHFQPFTVRQSTAGSLNIAAIKTMQFAGGNAVLNTMQRLGVNNQVNDGLAWAIGARDVSPLQMANAYETFANNGVRVQPQSILDVWDNLGHNLYHYNTNKPVGGRVFSPQVSYLMTSVLIDEPDRLVEFSGDHDLSFTDIDPNCAVNFYCAHQVAAKTGTTDLFRDNWTIGYTPDVTVAVWVGNADNSPMRNVIGITGAAPIWHNVIESTLGYCNQNTTGAYAQYGDGVACSKYNFRFSKNPTWTFPVPPGVTRASLSSRTGLQGGGTMDYVIDGQAPMQP
ncbi:transglycosylase domain-containing protein [Dictyobacter kobayashii]|uniref:Uncharacterized protein n=1 Tax=Dictyobacter kobayashii TaxID=2014872 RepID=A0A402AFP4_9CHLR|nr:transglycosylase domain-containing protein [Dictyobacter kobayashii]GCE17884.1 hypothetical protein KDK_16840 [Dictyobacter kobayashii]